MSDDSEMTEKSSGEHLYRLIYNVVAQDPGLTKAEIPHGYGATDALLGASVMYPEDGSLGILFFSADGRTGGPLEDKEWFKIWILLAEHLAGSPMLSENKRKFCRTVFETITAALEPMRGE